MKLTVCPVPYGSRWPRCVVCWVACTVYIYEYKIVIVYYATRKRGRYTHTAENPPFVARRRKYSASVEWERLDGREWSASRMRLHGSRRTTTDSRLVPSDINRPTERFTCRWHAVYICQLQLSWDVFSLLPLLRWFFFFLNCNNVDVVESRKNFDCNAI